MTNKQRAKIEDAEPEGSNDTGWQGIDQSTEDPEEARVMFSAVDSFLSVHSGSCGRITAVTRVVF